MNDFIKDSIDTLNEQGYITLEDEDSDIFYKLLEYINQMGKNLMYVDDSCTKKTYKEIYEDLNDIVRGF